MSRAIASGCSATTGSRRGDRAAMHRGRPSGALAFCKRRERRRTENGQNAGAADMTSAVSRLRLQPRSKERAWGKSRIWQAYSRLPAKEALAAEREEKRWKNRAFGIYRTPCSLYVIMNAEAEILLSGFFHRDRAGDGSADHGIVALPELLDFPCFYSRPLYRGIPQNRAV